MQLEEVRDILLDFFPRGKGCRAGFQPQREQYEQYCSNQNGNQQSNHGRATFERAPRALAMALCLAEATVLES